MKEDENFEDFEENNVITLRALSSRARTASRHGRSSSRHSNASPMNMNNLLGIGGRPLTQRSLQKVQKGREIRNSLRQEIQVCEENLRKANQREENAALQYKEDKMELEKTQSLIGIVSNQLDTAAMLKILLHNNQTIF